MGNTASPDVLADFAAASASPDSVKASYTPSHATVSLGEKVTGTGVKRDSDGVPFVAITRTRADGETKTTYDRADRVAQYLSLLAQVKEQGA